MNNIFDSVEIKMIEELSKQKVLNNTRYTDKKKFLKDLIRSMYFNLKG